MNSSWCTKLVKAVFMVAANKASPTVCVRDRRAADSCHNTVTVIGSFRTQAYWTSLRFPVRAHLLCPEWVMRVWALDLVAVWMHVP